MIQFNKIADNIKSRGELAPWAEVYNNHIDEMNDDRTGVGCWYNTINYNADMINHKPYIRQSFIWDEKQVMFGRSTVTRDQLPMVQKKQTNLTSTLSNSGKD